MPERLQMIQDYWQYLWLPFIGALIGLGQLLGSTEQLTPRIIIGRALSSGGLAIASASVLIWIPDIQPVALAGVAAVSASLGTSFLEKLVQRLLGGHHCA